MNWMLVNRRDCLSLESFRYDGSVIGSHAIQVRFSPLEPDIAAIIQLKTSDAHGYSGECSSPNKGL